MNAEQSAAVEATGTVFVSAGAGTGKTAVLVERFTRAVCERGLPVDSILVITYTERAAAELRGRIRLRLTALGRADLTRELDSAWISTIHGFCHRLLKAHPFEAGLDPRFRVLDEAQGRVLRSEAFQEALAGFCRDGDPDRVSLLATYGARGLRRMLTSVFETLRSAGRPLELVLGEAPQLAERIDDVREAAHCLLAEGEFEGPRRVLELLEGATPPDVLLDLSGFAARGGPKERFSSYDEARSALERAALDELALRDRALLQELLSCFAAAYREAKARESALDFEDLQLGARDLLLENDALREQERWRFRAILVDEFQDTNRLQCGLIDLLRGEDAFFVGDEFQSIYGFRHADVEVFRERRAEADVLPLTKNYRSRPEVLAVINHLFGADFGNDYQPLAAAAEFPDPVFGTPVELLVTDKASYAGNDQLHWRRAEARQIARRVSQLVESGAARAGEIVLLFAAGTDAEVYEEELREAGLPTHRSTGRGYYSQQQVVDLLAYLRLLHNRYDDEALVTVLASPFVGSSNDGLVLLRQAASKRPLFVGLERSLPTGLDARDERLFRAFRQRYERLAALASTVSLERLCEEIIARHDYDLAVLARWDGRRRYANLRKLARLARSYEELRGPDIEGFVRFVLEQEAVGARELEAVAEEEGADAVRLLTIHAAKGLEFKVVIVADAGRDRAGPRADEILALPDGRFGFRVVDPASGERLPAFEYEAVRQAGKAAEEAERRRLYYVAMTRAIDRLIVSGAIDPARRVDAGTPIGWVLGRLGVDLAELTESPVELEREGARLLIRIDRALAEPQPSEAEQPVSDLEQLELFRPGERVEPAFPAPPALAELVPVPVPPLQRVRRLSYSALALHERCSYRYYAERIAGMRERRGPSASGGEGGLAATEIGDAVHRLLERVERSAPAVPSDLRETVRAWYPAAREEELDRIEQFVSSYCTSELASRLTALDGVTVEPPFAFEHDGVLLHGRLDLLQLQGGSALVVDYKTNSLAEGAPEEIVEGDYRLQRLVYALACFRAGVEEVEVVYTFLERPDAVVSTSFVRAELPALEQELSRAIARIDSEAFRPTPSEFVCSGCPVLDVVCAGPRLRGDPSVHEPVLAAAG